ncbi:DUF6221 family protein [Micromonospora sp. DT229]|uniref:DUF6221 family protein n=1 Tax=Micromonospora sp. DT229 TaxID=3393430 RepID=UPI003CE70D84
MADDLISALIAWLRQQLDDDERIATAARQAAPGTWAGMHRDVHAIDPQAGSTSHVLTADTGALAVHAARHHPDRVLRDVAANRRILDLYDVSTDEQLSPDGWELMKHTVRALALTYADRPGYLDEWRVTA